MSSLYTRGNTLWCRLKDASGKWVSKRTPYNVNERRKAERFAEHAQQLLDKQRLDPTAKPLIVDTVSAFALDVWIKEREQADEDWKNDLGRLKHHVLPVIGDMKLADVRAPQIVELFRNIRFPKDADKKLAQRTIYNIYAVVSALFRDAQLKGLIEATPCVLTDRQLGPLVDKDPEWRLGAVFTREKAEILISDERIPFDRKLYYGFGLLAGMRPGEIAALRWRHYSPEIEPLGKLTVAHAYNTRKNRAKGTKTNSVRHVPVHPTLAAMLAEWRLSGWTAMMGRQPEPDDLILPLPPKAVKRRRHRTGEPYRSGDYASKRWREEDHPMLGWRYRELYATKSTFITLALEDGADADVIEAQVTHTKTARRAFDGYVRSQQWAKTCAEVAKLRLARRQPEFATSLATVIPLSSESLRNNGGGGGSRTRVRKCVGTNVYACRHAI